MPLLTGLAIAGIGLSAAGTATSAIMGSKAAGAQTKAAMSAAELQHQDQQDSLNFQKMQDARSQKQLAPWLAAGTQSINTLSGLLSTPGQGLLTPWTDTFKAPTGAEAAATPGYQFALQTGQNAIQNSAAASGGLLSTGAMKTLDQYSQGLADSTYNDTYNRALSEYQQRYNIFQGNQTNTFNRLAGVAGVGQQAVNTSVAAGQQTAGNVANINLSSGAQIGNSLQNAGAARASGYASIANSINGGIGSSMDYLMLSRLLSQQKPTQPDPWAGVGI